mmetsp:Transcript_21927/g.66619  ORF Transcript_21927/g.66619 Transcript_21927/m.66619 type:complete len:117 (+) Transcript_21927:97-447(+)
MLYQCVMQLATLSLVLMASRPCNAHEGGAPPRSLADPLPLADPPSDPPTPPRATSSRLKGLTFPRAAPLPAAFAAIVATSATFLAGEVFLSLSAESRCVFFVQTNSGCTNSCNSSS